MPSDLLLLDEPSNHLDLHALEWLTTYLRNSNHTIIVVSHDRSFLEICTDIITFEHKQLTYHPGPFSAYELQQQEKTARHAQILDASERQKAKAVSFLKKQEAAANKKKSDPKKQRQAKMIREKKLDRIGNYREDGKRYKNFSLSKLSEDSIRLAQKVQVEADDPIVRMKFPDPTWSSSMPLESSLINTESLYFGYDCQESMLLNRVTISVQPGSKISVVGRNGAGKTTLLKLLTNEIDPAASSCYLKGRIYNHPSLRIGYVSQYSVEELREFADMTVVEYADKTLRSGKASANIIRSAAGNVRQYLRSFGLGGKHAHRLIRSLSGGERMRLCFATVLAEQPHLLVLDEPTNHLDIETLDALATALNAYNGAVIIVSHNQHFLSGFCKELWVVEDGIVEVRHNGGESFEALFAEYRNDLLTGSENRTAKRQAKAIMARKARQLRTGAKQGTGLIP